MLTIDLDDDSSQLEEVKELFSSVTLPLKPDKLMKVSTSWRSKVEGLCAEGSKDGEGEEGAEEGSESKASKKKSTSEVRRGLYYLMPTCVSVLSIGSV